VRLRSGVLDSRSTKKTAFEDCFAAIQLVLFEEVGYIVTHHIALVLWLTIGEAWVFGAGVCET
jgi:hypothetical protein